MMPTDQEPPWYWNARHLAGTLPDTYCDEPSDLMGADSLFFSKAPALSLTPTQERKRMDRWREALPHMKLKTLIVGPRVDQTFFDLVTQIPSLEALDLDQSTVTSIASLENCQKLKALIFGSRSPVPSLAALSKLPNLRHLNLTNMRASHDLAFASNLALLEEFDFSWYVGDSTHQVDSLWPLVNLQNLRRLAIRGIKVKSDGLAPLHKLSSLVSLHVSFYFRASEFAALRSALPSLKYGSPFDDECIREFCKP